MAISTAGRATSLAFTGAGAATSPMTDIREFDFSNEEEMIRILDAGARVNNHWRGPHTASLTVTTHDIDNWSDFVIGEVLTSVILTVGAAVEADDGGDGGSFTITFSKAIVASKGNLTHGNDDDSPAEATVTFELHRAAADSSDPTVAIAAVI